MHKRFALARAVRLGLFWLIGLLLPSLVLIGVLETGLRLAGYGYPTGYFRRIPARTDYATNESFGRRFFPSSLVRVPLPCLVSKPKPEKTYRIFLLGSSAAQGFPESRYGMGRILEAMLNDTASGMRFEVINTGMTAINSNVVLSIARDCAALEPDLFVVYMGNNEVIGPFGPGTVFGGGSPSRSLIRFSLWLKTMKVGQLLADLAHSLGGARAPDGIWTGMQMFLANRVRGDDPRLDDVAQRFGENLRDICRVAGDAGAPVLLCSVASNLRDNEPFASLHRSDLGSGEEQQWEAAYRAGVELQGTGRVVPAAERYREALAIDPTHAELQFRLGQCLAAVGQTREASEHYTLAREWDALRFRACDPINAVIRSVAAEGAERGVVLVDAERVLAEDPATPAGVPGDEWFWDHVHFRWEGNYLMARILFQKIVGRLSTSGGTPSRPPSSPPQPERCAELLLLTDFDRYSMTQRLFSMMEKPPFAGRSDHERRSAARNEELAALCGRLNVEAMERTRTTYVRAVARDPEDLYCRETLARLLGNVGDLAGAERQWRELLQRIPGVTDWESGLGLTLLDQGRTAEALTIFRNQLRRNRRSVDALTNIGFALVRAGRMEDAVTQFERAVTVAPNAPEPLNNLGLAAQSRGDLESAAAYFRRALEIEPSFGDANMNLAAILAEQGRILEAMDHCRIVLHMDPCSWSTSLLLARLNLVEMRFAEAEQIVRRGLEVHPRSTELRAVLARALAGQGDIAGAVSEYEAMLLLDPDDAQAHFELGCLLAEAGKDGAVAARHLRRVLELRPDWPPALDRLAWLLVTTRDAELVNPTEAFRLAERACQLSRNREPDYLRTAAEAHAAAGNAERAVALATEARERLLELGQPEAIHAVDQELERYRRMLTTNPGSSKR